MMIMKRNKVLLMLCILLAVVTIGVSYAWIAGGLRLIIPRTYYGKTQIAYFESGDGTKDSPFVISNKVHLYNLAWLQYLGYFNQRERLNDELDQTYFVLKNDIDMEGLIIPPIGTTEYPFLGNFNGQGNIVRNVTTANVKDAFEFKPSAAAFKAANSLLSSPVNDTTSEVGNIIGFFGVVGKNAAMANKTHYDNEAHYSLEENAIVNFGLDSTVINDSSENTLVGIVAGYSNATIANVSVSTSAKIKSTILGNPNSISSITSNLSDYTLMGFVTDAFKDSVDIVKVQMDKLTTGCSQYTYAAQGNAASWGGSIDMYALLQRIVAVGKIPNVAYKTTNGTATDPQVPKSIIEIRDADGSLIQQTVTSYFTINELTISGSSNASTQYFFSSENAGTYYYYKTSGSRPHNYMLGLRDDMKRTIVTIQYLDSTYEAYDYSSNGQFLNLDGNHAVVGGASATTHWCKEGNYLFAYNIETGDFSNKHYLYFNGTTLTTSTTQKTTWIEEDDYLYCINNDALFYLSNTNGQWEMQEPGYVRINHGTNFLSQSGGTIVNRTTESTATKWYRAENQDGSFILFSFVGAERRYMSMTSGTISLTSNESGATSLRVNDENQYSFTEDVDNEKCIYYIQNGVIRYVQFNSPNWGVQELIYNQISDGTNYLTQNNGVIGNSTTSGSATKWYQINSSDDSFNLFCMIGEDRFYLRVSNGTISLTDNQSNATSFLTDDVNQEDGQAQTTIQKRFFLIDEGETRYLCCQGGTWGIQETGYLYIKSGTNYLSYANGNMTNATVETSATKWHRIGSDEKFKLYCMVGTEKQYLVVTNGTIALTNTPDDDAYWIINQDQAFDISGDDHNAEYYCYVNNENLYFLVCQNGTWSVQEPSYIQIHAGTNYLTRNDQGIGNVQNADTATKWYRLDGTNGTFKLFCLVGIEKQYLKVSNGVISLTSSSDDATLLRMNDGNDFSIFETNNQTECIYFIENETLYYLNYQGGWGVQEPTYYRINDGTNYLTRNGSNVGNVTGADAAVKWYRVYETNNQFKLFCINGTEKQYLTISGSQISLTANGTVLTITDGEIRVLNETNNRCIAYNNNAWTYVALSTQTFYKIKQATADNYLSYSGSNNNYTIVNQTSADEASLWVLDGNYKFKIPNTSSYLRINYSGNIFNSSYSLQISTTTSNNTFTQSNSQYYVSVSQGWRTTKAYLQYNNGWRVGTGSGTQLTLVEIKKKVGVGTLSVTNTSNVNAGNMLVTNPQETDLVSMIQHNPQNANIGMLVRLPIQSANAGKIQIVVSETIHAVTTTQNDQKSFTVSDPKAYGVASYIPLTTSNTGEDYSNFNGTGNLSIFDVADGNTGYIVGGFHDTTDNEKGDTRISAYDIAKINGSYTPEGGFSKVYTITDNASALEINLSTGAYTGGQFTKFGETLAQLKETLIATYAKNQSVYGIHFMNSLISTERLISAEQVTVLNQTYENYELPEDSIDFNLLQKGLITVYAGSYHPANNSLFSLHQIERDGTKITAIKEIKHIYSTGSSKDPYIYMYKNNTFSDGQTHATDGSSFASDGKNYSLVFKCEWLWNSGKIVKNTTKVYYFEIPVNEGEYALGSVEGATGAYIIYLDLSANAQLVERATVVEEYEETTNSYDYPIGATYANTPIPADNTNPVVPSLAAPIAVSTKEAQVNVTSDTNLNVSGLGTPSYLAPGLTLSGTSTNVTIKNSTVTKIRRITYYDYNIAMDRYTITEVTLRKAGEGDTEITISAWAATYEEGVWGKGSQLVNDEVLDKSKMEESSSETGVHLYKTSGNDTNETLRFENNSFAPIGSDSLISDEYDSFDFQIVTANPRKIDYAIDLTVTKDFDQNLENHYAFDNLTYSAVVTTPIAVTIANNTLAVVSNTVDEQMTSP